MATEKRLIDANEISYHKSGFPKGDGFDSGLDWAFREDIDKLPTVDAVEVVHGRWENCGGDLHSSGYAIFCTVCNKVHFVHRKYSLGGLNCEELFKKPKYCPSCGAIMESEE